MKDFSLYPPNFVVDTSTYRVKALVVLGVAILLCLLLSFPPPNTCIGLGRSKSSVKKWQIWTKFVIFTVPSVVIAGTLIPKLIDTVIKILTR